MILLSEFVDLNTATGTMRTYVHRPKSESKFPAILFYSEIFQQTGPIERAAKILASHGFVVLVPEVFHELNEIGTVLNYDDAGRDKGNADKDMMYEAFLKETKIDLKKIFDTDKVGNPISDIVDSYYIAKVGYKNSIKGD